jgi:hypothetical protein
VAYWPPGPDVAIFYDHDGKSIPNPGIAVLGKIDSCPSPSLSQNGPCGDLSAVVFAFLSNFHEIRDDFDMGGTLLTMGVLSVRVPTVPPTPAQALVSWLLLESTQERAEMTLYPGMRRDERVSAGVPARPHRPGLEPADGPRRGLRPHASLDQVAEGYGAMDKSRAIKALLHS